MGRAGIVLILAIGILIIWVMYTYNKFVAKQHAIDTIWDEADFHLQLRHTLVPILVDTAEPLMKDESEILKRVSELPDAIEEASTLEETEKLENELSNLFS